MIGSSIPNDTPIPESAIAVLLQHGWRKYHQLGKLANGGSLPAAREMSRLYPLLLRVQELHNRK